MDWGMLALALVVTGLVWARIAQARREERLLVQQRDSYRQAITRDPKNAGAHEALGDSLRAAGHHQDAQQAYLASQDVSGEEAEGARIQYKLRQLELDRREHAAHSQRGTGKPTPELYFCPLCGGANLPTRRVCETCGASLPHETFFNALRDKEVLRATAEAGACLLVLLAALAVAAAQPLEVKGVLIMATVIVVAWRFLQALGSPRV